MEIAIIVLLYISPFLISITSAFFLTRFITKKWQLFPEKQIKIGGFALFFVIESITRLLLSLLLQALLTGLSSSGGPILGVFLAIAAPIAAPILIVLYIFAGIKATHRRSPDETLQEPSEKSLRFQKVFFVIIVVIALFNIISLLSPKNPLIDLSANLLRAPVICVLHPDGQGLRNECVVSSSSAGKWLFGSTCSFMDFGYDTHLRCVVAKAERESDIQSCEILLKESELSRSGMLDAFARCLAPFEGSTDHLEMCNKHYASNASAKDLTLSKCISEKQLSDLLPLSDSFDTLSPGWFATFVLDNRSSAFSNPISYEKEIKRFNELGINPNARDIHGRTVLISSASLPIKVSGPAILALISFGVDLYAVDDSGKNVLDYLLESPYLWGYEGIITSIIEKAPGLKPGSASLGKFIASCNPPPPFLGALSKDEYKQQIDAGKICFDSGATSVTENLVKRFAELGWLTFGPPEGYSGVRLVRPTY